MDGLFGRDAEVAHAAACLDGALGGDGGTLLLLGEAGIGKSRLARAVADLAEERGATVVWGRCWEVGGAPALWPWIEILRALGEDLFEGSAAGPDGGHDQRFALFQRVSTIVRASAERKPVVILLDDAHGADVPTLHLLLFIARSLRGARVLLVVTAREVESRASQEIEEMFAKLARESTVSSLRRLGRDDVAAWLAARADSRAVDDVYAVTEGNPLFVEEMLRIGSDRPNLPHGLSAILDEHLRRLSGSGRALLEQASVLGRDIELGQVARLANASLDDAEALLHEAEKAGVIIGCGDGRCSFAHVLIRDRLYDGLSPSRRAQLHWRAAEMLGTLETDPITIAHHLLAGADAGDPGVAARAALRGAERATSQLGFEAAITLAERVLALPRDVLGARLACDAELVLADALARAGNTNRARATADRAAVLARQLGDGDALARAALLHSVEMTSGTVDPDMIARLEEALSALPDESSPIRARLMARLAAANVPPTSLSQAHRADQLARDAMEMARQLDEDTRLYCLRYVASSSGYRMSAAERLALADEMLALARKRKQILIFMQGAGWQVASLTEVGRHAEAAALLEELREVVFAMPQPFHRWRWLASKAALAAFRGDFEKSESLADDFLRLAEEGGNFGGKIAWALHRCSLAFTRGDPASIARDEERVLPILSLAAPLRAYVAWVHAALGRTEAARLALGDVSDEMFPISYPWTIIAADTAAMIRDRALCAVLYEHLAADQFRHRFFWGPAGSFAFGPTPLVLGRLARVLGREADSRACYERAIALCRECGATPLLALAERELGASAPVCGTSSAPSIARLALRRDGDGWLVEPVGGTAFRLKHGKGVEYLHELLGRPGQDVFVLDLIGAEHGPSDAGSILDGAAKEAYRARLEDLADELAEAERFSDAERARRAREELDAIGEQLSAAIGLGGRDRRAGSHVERARVNVQRRIKDAVRRIGVHDRGLAQYLEVTVKTGTFCSYRPI